MNRLATFLRRIPALLGVWGALTFSAGPALAQPATAGAVDEDFDHESAARSARVSDPGERLNRAIFTGNEYVYRAVLRPLARGYERVVPRAVRRGFDNFFGHLRFPVRFVSAIAQAKGGRALREGGRFAVNTVVGLGGLLRVSDDIAALAPEPVEDMGQAFGQWGLPPGAFVILPLLGPATLRDLVGSVADAGLTPIYWRFELYDEWETRFAVHTVDNVAAAPALLRGYDAVRAGALDPYLAVRSAYLDRRRSEIRK